ncbi:Spo0E like sporulation regulatory protein [Alkalithermobacter thermoalcaliphilus JW-YL-7 = DSM 7308]|uniref:Spo0E like sporulation regulatory protein n=1 Tax=Alkalithermobacter thermoalcaliphilus JW-YL-7 = DSM 7308 TaxID=1121328 RepID=A0A150FRX0_CLOPD|nr:Sporulation stage 0, Spo0E-like regulatory phosphatase [[Clostridium] paradoxum JW-YL-7 = DSM 7308]SHK37237.1 Spo0E like sporulation regulatory protein [[Clostridium] paradoxum JW-YL-7 = DSM 7308]
MIEVLKLKLDIEKLREKLNNLIVDKDYNLDSDEVIKLSQELDKLLSLYEKIKR